MGGGGGRGGGWLIGVKILERGKGYIQTFETKHFDIAIIAGGGVGWQCRGEISL